MIDPIADQGTHRGPVTGKISHKGKHCRWRPRSTIVNWCIMQLLILSTFSFIISPDIPNFYFIFPICSIKYEAGGVTVFALSVKKSGYDVLTFPAPLSSQKVDVYLLTPVGPEGITSKWVLHFIVNWWSSIKQRFSKHKLRYTFEKSRIFLRNKNVTVSWFGNDLQIIATRNINISSGQMRRLSMQ